MEKNNVYVGQRYVPKLMGEWNKTISYEGLSIVTNEGNSYTSKKRVPIGIDLLNEEYWVSTGNYNAQIEQYRSETSRVQNEVNQMVETVDDIELKTDWIDSRFFLDLQSAVDYACIHQKQLKIYGNHNLTTTLNIPEELTIEQVDGIITATAEMACLFRAFKKVILKNVILDGDNLANNIIQTETELPTIINCELINGLGDGVITHLSNSIGSFKAVETKIKNCGRGFMVYGKDDLSTTVELLNCQTENVNGQPYYFERHDKVVVKDGIFKNSPNLGVNAGYKCNKVYVSGGEYHNCFRGATFGMGVKQGHVINTLSIGCVYAGVSIDTKLADNSVPVSDIEVSGNIAIDCNYAIRIQAKGVNFHDNISKNHTAQSAPFYFNEAEAVVSDTNIAIGGNGRAYMFNNSIIHKNKKTSNLIFTRQTSNGSIVYEKVIQKFTTYGDINTETEIVLCDVSGELGYTIKMPRYYHAIGNTVKIINQTGGVLDINCYDGLMINGLEKITLTEKSESVDIMWDGDGWITI